MKIVLTNVGSINKGEIEVIENCLNIKYAANGTGKSTFATFLEAWISNDEEIKQRYRPFNTVLTPSLSFLGDAPSSCMVYNEDYISRFLFQQDDALHDTHHLLMQTPVINKAIEEFEKELSSLKEQASDDTIQSAIDTINRLKNLNPPAAHENANFSTKFGRAIKEGCNVLRANSKTIQFKDLIESSQAPAWYKWRMDGHKYAKKRCPYCGQSLSGDYEETRSALKTIFDRVDAKNNVEVRSVLLEASPLLAHHGGVDALLATTKKPTEDEYSAAAHDISALIGLAEKIQWLKALNYLDLRRLDKSALIEKLRGAKIDILSVGNEALKRACERINANIDDLLRSAEKLQTITAECDKNMSHGIARFKTFVNEYLKRCGIPYQFEINETDPSHPKTVLKRDQTDVDNWSLSYGERNSLCFALFLIDACQHKPDLIVLDDPISSFDSGKRFSMFFSAFNDKEFSLKNKTAILLTHDITPLIDFVKRKSKGVGNNVKAWRLVNSNGTLTEKEVTSKDIDSSVRIEKSLASSKGKPMVVRLVHARRYLEIIGKKKSGYDIISSLFHGRDTPERRMENGAFQPLSLVEIQEGTKTIRDFSIEEDYDSLHELLSNARLWSDYQASRDTYEKVAIARILFDRFEEGLADPFKHSIDSVFHIEQEYLYNCEIFAEEQIPHYIADYVDCEIRKLMRDHGTDTSTK